MIRLSLLCMRIAGFRPAGSPSASSPGTGHNATGCRYRCSSRRLKASLSLLCLLTVLTTAKAADITLYWDAVAGAGSYRLYKSEGTAPFSLSTSALTLTRVTVSNVSTSAPTRFYVTAYNEAMAIKESGPSNIYTNFPPGTVPTPPPTGTVVLSVPVLNSTNLIYGQSVSGSATIKNGTVSSYALFDAGLVALPPGATAVSGPWHEFTPRTTAQTISPGVTLTVPGTFTVPTNGPAGQWSVYLAARDTAGVWLPDGPTLAFSVTVPPLTPLPAPTNLRAVQITGRRYDLSWQNDITASTLIERSVESAPFERVANVAPGTLHYSTQIEKRRLYVFRAQSAKASVLSPYSNSLIISAR